MLTSCAVHLLSLAIPAPVSGRALLDALSVPLSVSVPSLTFLSASYLHSSSYGPSSRSKSALFITKQLRAPSATTWLPAAWLLLPPLLLVTGLLAAEPVGGVSHTQNLVPESIIHPPQPTHQCVSYREASHGVPQHPNVASVQPMGANQQCAHSRSVAPINNMYIPCT